ncbi:hypothetical protein ACTFBT_00925 [Streptomyces microflavus]|uniref:Uncharacterized protein n=1 Tax=Streptomyces microflavus TaxID=1919 RepID=A0A7J0D660_STRMI|nr:MULTISPECIES: hypothetical protein [Streptomyces]MDX2978208.1 hypothetical protein [Streptomyces sp. NRRL_B-2249]GFN09495.1 hypothetical protein Smic_80510 [Streptomyces microflavus]GGX67582.1 hypothetical protein GCM10010298_35480 [Streptomyces microflavus]
MTELTEAVHLSDPLGALEPVPNYACDVCASLGRQREEARARRDMTVVSDCNVEIRRHPHTGRGRSV